MFATPPDRIKRVTIWHRQYVDGIELETENGVLPKLGATGKHRDIRTDSFELDEDEFITGVSVEYWTYVDRITFHTNKTQSWSLRRPWRAAKEKSAGTAGQSGRGSQGRHWELIDSIQLMVV